MSTKTLLASQYRSALLAVLAGTLVFYLVRFSALALTDIGSGAPEAIVQIITIALIVLLPLEAVRLVFIKITSQPLSLLDLLTEVVFSVSLVLIFALSVALLMTILGIELSMPSWAIEGILVLLSIPSVAFFIARR